MGSEIVCNSKGKKIVVEQEHRGRVRAVFCLDLDGGYAYLLQSLYFFVLFHSNKFLNTKLMLC